MMLKKKENQKMERKNDYDIEDIAVVKAALAKAEKNIILLKNENKRFWDENIRLRQELQFIKNSRKYKYADYLSDIYKNPMKVFSYTKKVIFKIYNKFKNRMLYKIRKIKSKLRMKNYNMENIDKESINIFERCPEDKVILKRVTIIVCVHNALDEIRECLYSLVKNRSFPYRIILIDDGSDESTSKFLRENANLDYIKYIRNEKSIGYTKSANIGLKESDDEYIVLLNSDTVVTQGWVEKLLECYEKHEKTGIVSALSNAASYQSVPEVRDRDSGEWKINELDSVLNAEMMGWIIERESQNKYPQVKCVNGFCMMIKRQVMDRIGYLDEELFPLGYGEEVDFCIRAFQAGYELRVADNVYIYHKKTKSFKTRDRNKLVSQSADKLKKKYTAIYDNTVKEMESSLELDEIRENIINKLNYYKDICSRMKGRKIAFLVTAAGGSGGVNSICQEVGGMRALGIDAHIINSYDYQEKFDFNYPELTAYTHYFKKDSINSLIKLSKEFDLIIATIFTTVQFLREVYNVYPEKKLAYYVQDYEPYFFTEDDKNYKEAKESYNLLKDICLFAKTQWIIDTVRENNGVQVELVQPSIDTKIYNAYVIKEKRVSETVCISAMIRPKTERRNPKGTLELFRLLKEKYNDKVSINIFGCEDKELEPYNDILDYSYYNHGILKRGEVAKVLAVTDIFVDLSTYQAFGRTGLESMCLGCIPVVPECGGADKYAVDGKNAIVGNTLDILEMYHRVCEIIDDLDKRKKMQREALVTGKEYSVRKAAWSEIEVFNKLF